MFKPKLNSKAKDGKTAKPFIEPKKEVKTDEFGLNKYFESGVKPKKNEVHLLGYYHNDRHISFEINQQAATKLDKKEFDRKVAIKEVKGLVIKKTQLTMKESNALYICAMNMEEEKEKEKM